MRNITKLVICMMAIMLLIVAGGCGSETSEGYKVITSDDGFCQIEVPNDWSSQSDLNDVANIQMANLKQELYVITISEYKMDFADDATLEYYSDITYQAFVDSLTDPVTIDGPIQLDINGRRAILYEVRGEVEAVKAVCLHCAIDGEEGFHQVLAWTLSSRFAKNESLLMSVINSFREVITSSGSSTS